jgi:hypothetical protein
MAASKGIKFINKPALFAHIDKTPLFYNRKASAVPKQPIPTVENQNSLL